MSEGGFTRSFRRKWRNPVFRNFRDGGIWSYLCDNAAWQDTTIRFCERLVTLKRGQIAVSERFLAEGFCCDRQVIRRLFDALDAAQMITRQKTHGGTILTLCNYEEYQAAAKDANPPDLPSQTQGEPRANPNKKEDKEGNEGNLEEARQAALTSTAKPAPKAPKGTRLPDDFVVPDAWRVKAAAYRSVAGLPPVDVDTEAIKFTNHFVGAPGEKGRKSNWERTFTNWILNARTAFNGKQSHPTKETADERAHRRRAGLAAAVMAGDMGASRAGSGFCGLDLAGDGGRGTVIDAGESEIRGGDAGPDPRTTRAA